MAEGKVKASVDDSKTEGPEQAEPYEVVRYLQAPGRRLISHTDWEKVGIDHPDVWWDNYNNYTVKKADLKLTPEQFNRFIASDAAFSIETVEPE